MLQKKFVAIFAFISFFFTGNGQVNLQTGSATFSLPMFSWQDDKSRLNAVVALSYSSGNGLKVNDVASNEGQGWNLVAGGVITRMQVGEPDDQRAYNGDGDHTEQDLTRYPAGYLYQSVPSANGCPNALTRYPIYGPRNIVYSQRNLIAEDKQLDYFSFQFNGKSGMFILDTTKNGDAISGTGIPLGDTKLKITFQTDDNLINSQIRTTITSFTIQDVDGLIYKFSVHGVTKILKLGYCDESLTQLQAQPTFKNGKVYHQAEFDDGTVKNPFVIGSWYLSEIDDPFTGRNITFNYAMHSINAPAGADLTNNWDQAADHRYSIITHKHSITTTPDILGISFPDGHHVNFTYSSAQRYDLSGAYALAAVDVLYQSRYLSEYQLNTQYFILNRYGAPVSAYQKSVSRLCLRSVRKIGVDLKDDSPPYIFDYYTGSNISDDFTPPPFYHLKDIWGYYNGNNSKDFNGVAIPTTKTLSDLSNTDIQGLCFAQQSAPGVVTLNAKPGYAKNGLLRQIIYPTGGTLTYQYDQNTGQLNSSTTNIGGVHVSQTSSTDGGHSNGCALPVTTQYSYTVGGTGTASSLWGIEQPVNTMTMASHYAPEWKSFHFTWSGPSCYYHFTYPGILSLQQSVSLTDFQNFMIAAAPVLGILTIITDVMDVVNLCCGDTGVLSWVAVIVDIIGYVLQVGITCFHDDSKDNATTVSFDADLNSVSPLPMQFWRVEITESPGTAGKTVEEFTNSDDYPVWYPTNPVFSSKQRFAPWAYGLPKLTTVYDLNGNKIKETENHYDFTFAQNRACSHYLGLKGGCALYVSSCKCSVQKSSSQRSVDWADITKYGDPAAYTTDLTSNADLLADISNFYSGRTELDSTAERIYNVSDPTKFVQTVKRFTYDFNNYEVTQIATTESNGDVNYKKISYSGDYNTGILNTLDQNNVISLPVSTTTWQTKAVSHNDQYLEEKVTEYSLISNGDIRPCRTLEQRFPQPQPYFGSTSNYKGPGASNNPPYKQTQTFSYDASSNLVGIKDEGGRSVTNIYDYDNKYIVATVINADPVEDKPCYTSFETSGLGGWFLTGQSPAYANSGITGFHSLTLASNSLTATLNSSKPYILSFWSTAGINVSNGCGLVKTGPAHNGFTYYEYAVTQGTSSVTVSGSGSIDELRIYPADSRMRSTSYDPLIGKTSECDENNRITYYEYDNLARLQFIKDENRNIVKMYEYNNISPTKQNGCPGSYSNHLITELFTKSDCGPGYAGTQFPYSIPANKYTSSVSQTSADAKAEIELMVSGQTTANTNGSCLLIYYNSPLSVTDSTENCPEGQIGGWVTYTVPAGRYSSTISQADADQKAIDDTAANAQYWANSVAHRSCAITTNPDWVWPENGPTNCQTPGGSQPPHQFIQETDMNPNSPTYNQTRWSDIGPQDACPAGTYYNASASQSFTRNNCAAGYTGSAVTYTVPAGKYSSTVSQAAADQLATSEINANGQNYADTTGTCTQLVTINYSNTRTNGYTISFTNNATGAFFNASPTGSGGVLYQVPIGVYQVHICPINNYTPNNNYQILNNYLTGVVCATFYNISITGNTTVYCY